MAEVFRINGPPGTGKTTRLVASLEKQLGGPRTRPMTEDEWPACVVSMTRTAAAEVRQRKITLDAKCVGTLHSMARRSANDDRPIADAPDNLPKWNEQHGAGWQISGGCDPDDPLAGVTGVGGDLLSKCNIRRARLENPADDPELKAFWSAWQRHLADGNFVDFTGMIEQARDLNTPPPGDARMIYVDEAQDLSPLELELIWQWAEHAEKLFICGDPYQCVYDWRGASPAVFLDDIEATDDVLRQSYRVPRETHARAVRFLRKYHGNYKPFEYEPRDADGCVNETQWCNRAIVERAAEAYREGQTVMVAASCGYMLAPVTKLLAARGIPYGNPWSPKRWSPLRASKSINGLLAPFTEDPGDADFGFGVNEGDHTGRVIRLPNGRPLWTRDQLRAWIDPLKAREALMPGAKAASKLKAGESPHAPAVEWRKYFTQDDQRFLEQVEEPGELLKWFGDRLLGGKLKTLPYVKKIVGNFGAKALAEPPRVFVGTIHSFKGAEADVVVMRTDLSPMAYRLWVQKKNTDSVARLFYTGMTRARHELNLVNNWANACGVIC